MSMKKIVYLISDSTGETVARIGGAALGLFSSQVDRRERMFIRSDAGLKAVLDEIEAEPGAVVITMVDGAAREKILDAAARLEIPAVSVLQNVVSMFEDYFGETACQRMGGQYVVDDYYYRRVDAIDYAISHDDGVVAGRLKRADVILTGVSRTSKTPTCIYLAMKGVKAANFPLVPGAKQSEEFIDAVNAGIPVIGLTVSPSRLAQIRGQRLETLGQTGETEYASLEFIRKEVSDARLFFEQINAPVIDVTRRSIEETAAEIIQYLRKKRG